jgi:hypothetical protein
LKKHPSVDLISDVPPFGQLWYGEPNAVNNAIGYAMHGSRSHDAVVRVYDEAGNVIDSVGFISFLRSSKQQLLPFRHVSAVSAFAPWT